MPTKRWAPQDCRPERPEYQDQASQPKPRYPLVIVSPQSHTSNGQSPVADTGRAAFAHSSRTVRHHWRVGPVLLVILAALSIGYLGLSVLSAAIGWTGVAAVAIAALLVSLSYEIGGRH